MRISLFDNPERCVEKRERCVVCGSTAAKTLVKLPYSSPLMQSYWEQLGPQREHLKPLTDIFPFQVEQCSRCNLVFQSYVLRPESEASLYADIPESYFPGVRTQKWDNNGKFRYYAKTLELASIIFAVIHDKAPEETEVLDFGAGWGFFSTAARALGHRVEAVEINKSKLTHLQNLGIPCVTLPLQKKYDFIFADQVFEHLQDPVELLKSLAEGLSVPGGHILLGVPTFKMQGLAKRFAAGDPKTIWVFSPFYHINMYSREALQELGRQAGLKPVHFQPLIRANLHRLEERPLSKVEMWLKETGKNYIKQLRPNTLRVFDGLQLFRV